MKGLTFLMGNSIRIFPGGFKNLPRKPQNLGDNWPLASTVIVLIMMSLFQAWSSLISIETVKLAISQHRFYFDVHKVCGNLVGVNLRWVGGKHLFFQWIWTRYVYFYISLCEIMPPSAKILNSKLVFWLRFHHCQFDFEYGLCEIKVLTLHGEF